MLTRLVQLEVDGERLSPRQLRALTRNLITGGLTTTSQLLGNLLYQLLTVPGLEQVVRADEGALANAVEESLRIAPPLLFVARGCVRETSIGECPIAPGERVIVGTGSANRDELLFEDGDEFRVDRPNADQHLTFGYGPHVCPGARTGADRRPHRHRRVPGPVPARLGATRRRLRVRERADVLRDRAPPTPRRHRRRVTDD